MKDDRLLLFLDGTPESRSVEDFAKGLGVGYEPVPADELGAFWGYYSSRGEFHTLRLIRDYATAHGVE